LTEGLGLGSAGFVERHGLYSDEQAQAVVEVVARVEELGLRTVRPVADAPTLTSVLRLAGLSGGSGV
jgi:hypothetical protein